MRKSVVVGLSGGVDSAVAALLLKEQGYLVTGVFMNNWEEELGGECTAAADWEDAQNVAAHIGIPVYSVSFAEEYMQRVFSYFLDEYRSGRTPNPDVLCNREIKFDAFSAYAAGLGADFVATGHYCSGGAQTITAERSHAKLLKAADEGKDQTYFLNQVTDGQLDNVIFPLGGLKKSEVRRLAEERGLYAVAKKKDSTGICFIGERKFKQFLMTYLPAMEGSIVDTSGKEVGRHDGLMYYTLGQRRGLRLGGKSGQEGRWYVIKKELDKNRLVVSCGNEEELMSSELFCRSFNFIGGFDHSFPFRCTAKTRYRQPEQPCVVIKTDDGYRVSFDQPQRAITPGQYVVLYCGNRCLGGGKIENG